MRQLSSILAGVFLLAFGLSADFSYQQSTKITGGAMAGVMKMAGAFSKQARSAMDSSVMVKGDRMLNLHGDSAQVIDLNAETFTDIDYNKKTYSVTTFAQMADAMKKMLERMHQDPKEDMNFKIDVKDTGATRTIQNLPAHQMLLTLSGEVTDKKSGQKGEMRIVSDMWITRDVQGYDEVRTFYQRMGRKMALMPGALGGAGALQPGMAQGMSELYKQASKLEGVPVLQVIRIGDQSGAAGSPAGTQAQPQSTPPPAAGSPSASEAAASAITGRLGRFGGFGRKKKQETPKEETPAAAPETQAGDASSSAPASLIEMTTELKSFSPTAVDASKMEVPAGFKQVESPMVKALKD